MPAPGKRIIIVGAGLAGLTSAYELEKRGFETLVLEASDNRGGRIATAYYSGGLQAEYGLQEFWADNPAIDLAKELGLSFDTEEGEAVSSVVLDGKLQPFVQASAQDYFATFLTLPERNAFTAWLQKASVLRRQALTAGIGERAILALQNQSFSAWISQAALPHAVAEFIRLSIECELAESWDNFSALAGLLEFSPFLDNGKKNYHLHGGNSRLTEGLASRLHGSTLFSAKVVRIDRESQSADRNPIHVYYEKGKRLLQVDASAVLLAIPFTHVHAINFAPRLSSNKRQAIATLMRGQYVVVHLIVDREVITLWQNFKHSPFPILSSGPLGVIYGPQEDGDKNARQNVFTLLIHGQEARKVHMRMHNDILDDVVAELSRLWPGFAKYYHTGYVYNYHPAAVAVWPPGRSPIDALAQSLFTPEQGVYFAGDWLMGAHSDGAVISAQRAAGAIARDLAE